MNEDNVVNLPGARKELTITQKHQALKEFKESMPFLMELAQLQAEMAFSKFKILLAKGFTEQQAIELLKGTV